ncbi:MAG: AgmX/PglI C-terminal domain-containing protein [Myxococcota bacterium]|nr:AgmX/PglI C-terminal domain-containing protein [Myxococcota bacterium]
MTPPLSRPPAGVPASAGNAKYAVVAVLLVGGIVALLAWRSCSSDSARLAAPAPPPSALQSAIASANPKIDDVPPPPPTPDEKGGSAVGPRVVYVSGAGCDGKCAGTAPPELGQALQARAQSARRCYNQALSQDSSLKGHVTVAVRIGPTGNVCSAAVAANDMGTGNVANCAANIFRASGNYPSPHGGCIDATVPLSFVPQGQ